MEYVDRYRSTHEDVLHYTDYIYKCFKPNLSLWKETDNGNEQRIVIGNTATASNAPASSVPLTVCTAIAADTTLTM